MPKFSTVRDLRRANRSALLRPLFLNGPLSRTQLSAISGLSQATVSNVIGELQSLGLVSEAGAVDSDGGRPRQLLRVASQYGYVLGVDVGETRVYAELFNLAMEAQASVDIALPSGPNVEAVVAGIQRAVPETLRMAGLDGSRVFGVGIGVPGLVEKGDETVVHGQTIGWSGVPLARLLAKHIDLPLFIENGAKSLGQAEMWFGSGRGASDVVIVLVGSGVGASIVTGGSAYLGASNNAGEWGHTIVHIGGRTCRCGSAGCLEAYVGAEAIVQRYTEARGRPTRLAATVEAAITSLVSHSPRNRAAASVLQETAEYLGAGIASLINLFNPERIVLGGWAGLLLGGKLLPAIQDAARRHALHRPFAQTSITLTQLGDDAVAMGAATLPIEHLLATGTPGHSLPRNDG